LFPLWNPTPCILSLTSGAAVLPQGSFEQALFLRTSFGFLKRKIEPCSPHSVSHWYHFSEDLLWPVPPSATDCNVTPLLFSPNSPDKRLSSNSPVLSGDVVHRGKVIPSPLPDFVLLLSLLHSPSPPSQNYLLNLFSPLIPLIICGSLPHFTGVVCYSHFFW